MNWRQLLGLAIAAACLATPARAQGGFLSVRIYTVKPDRNADFLAATKEAAEILKKAGSDRYYSVWHSLSGDNVYARVDSYGKLADLDRGPDPKTREQAAQLSALTTRIIACTEHSTRFLDEVLPELSLPNTPDTPKMIRVLQTEARGDKINDYMALVKNEVLPTQKKAGVKSYTVARVRYGGASTGFVSVAGFDKWSDLDGGSVMQKALSPASYQQFLTKLYAYTVHSEVNVYSLVEASSFMPPMK